MSHDHAAKVLRFCTHRWFQALLVQRWHEANHSSLYLLWRARIQAERWFARAESAARRFRVAEAV